MAYTKRELVTAGSIIYLVVITGIASYATSRSNYLSLPIPTTLTGFTAALPLLSGLLLQASHSLTSAHHSRQKTRLHKSPPPPYITVVNTVILIYASVVISLLGTHATPAGPLLCGLESRWSALFIAKNGEAIRQIQDALKCCGLRTSLDRAWPFPDKTHDADACKVRFERSVGCMGRWRGEEQRAAGILMGAAVLVVVWELVLIVNPTFRRPAWLHSVLPHRLQIANGDEEGQNTTDPRRAIGFLSAGGGYSDHPVVEASESGDDDAPQRSLEGHVPELIPSGTTNGGEQGHSGHVENEWART